MSKGIDGSVSQKPSTLSVSVHLPAERFPAKIKFAAETAIFRLVLISNELYERSRGYELQHSKMTSQRKLTDDVHVAYVSCGGSILVIIMINSQGEDWRLSPKIFVQR